MTTEHEIKGVRIVKIISESRKPRGEKPRSGYRRVQAIVRIHNQEFTRHGDTKDGVFLIMKERSSKPKRTYKARVPRDTDAAYAS